MGKNILLSLVSLLFFFFHLCVTTVMEVNSKIDIFNYYIKIKTILEEDMVISFSNPRKNCGQMMFLDTIRAVRKGKERKK